MDSLEVVRERLSRLPRGNLTRKTIKGHTYTYLQWRGGGCVRSRVVAIDELASLKRPIAELDCLERRLSAMEGLGGGGGAFVLDVTTGTELGLLCESVSGWRERNICRDLRAFLSDAGPEVCILHGLRRIGKSTAMLQVIAGMDDAGRSDAAFVEVKVGDTLAALFKDMRCLQRLGYRYVFVDEVTLLEDFSEGAALLADIYARMGLRIVLSGADSLSFWFAEGTSLFDRAQTIHTTWIPYHEHASVLGTPSVDECICFGGPCTRVDVSPGHPSPTRSPPTRTWTLPLRTTSNGDWSITGMAGACATSPCSGTQAN